MSEHDRTRMQKVSWTSEGYRLAGFLHTPSMDRFPVVIGSHGLFSNGDSPKQISLAARCNQAGIGFLRFHHRGCGSSEGDFHRVTTLESRAGDIRSAVAWVRAHFGENVRIGLFGSSMGGAACLHAADRAVPDAMVTLAAPVESHSLWEAMDASGESDTVDPIFRRNRFSFDLSGRLSDIHHILILHGENDAVVPLQHAEIIFRHVREPRKKIVFPGGDHRVTFPHHQTVFLDETVQWMSRYLT